MLISNYMIMPTVQNIQFKDNWQGGPDWLQFEFHFEAEELNHLFLAKVGCQRVGPGKQMEAWQPLDERMIEPKEPSVVQEWRPDLSSNSSFQQRVQFKVVLLRAVAQEESTEFSLR